MASIKPSPHLGQGPRVALRHLHRRDYAEIAALTRESAELHRPWLGVQEPTVQAFERRLERFGRPAHEGFVICLRESGAIVGGVNVNDILRGSRQCGTLGFTAYAATTGRGYLTEGLGLVIRYAFGPLGLHRLEANIQPGNTRSLSLVQRLGFRYEGFSPAFQVIDGEWRDHERWALVSGNVRPTVPEGGASGRR
ncbi:GNAT family N-acetyltransferase [Streptomyces albidoflavus]